MGEPLSSMTSSQEEIYTQTYTEDTAHKTAICRPQGERPGSENKPADTLILPSSLQNYS